MASGDIPIEMRKFFTYSDRIVPLHHPRVVVETAVAQGADRSALIGRAEITPAMLASPDARISYQQFAVLVHSALKMTDNPALGIDVGRNLGIPQMGVLGLALLSSATGGSALDAALRNYRALAPCWELEVRVSGDLGVLRARESISLGRFLTFATEVLLAAFELQARFLLKGALPIKRIRLPYEAPAHVERYREISSAPIEFEQDGIELAFEAQVLGESVAFADPATAKLAEQLCAQMVPPQVPFDGLVAQVRRMLASPRGRPPDLQELAHALQTSTRSLRRSLHNMGTSYQELLDESRRRRAEDWVRSTEMTFEQMAHQLGFSNVRSFRRAFKRWTGRTPSAFRESINH